MIVESERPHERTGSANNNTYSYCFITAITQFENLLEKNPVEAREVYIFGYYFLTWSFLQTNTSIKHFYCSPLIVNRAIEEPLRPAMDRLFGLGRYGVHRYGGREITAADQIRRYNNNPLNHLRGAMLDHRYGTNAHRKHPGPTRRSRQPYIDPWLDHQFALRVQGSTFRGPEFDRRNPLYGRRYY
ncbi:hypothetical protein N431DRAFT_441094 [Stipitochalara longipes BDJ]|nr:hypothetical protein N431DRAFT_441094 [Stipitochalara longipes BDJ]